MCAMLYFIRVIREIMQNVPVDQRSNSLTMENKRWAIMVAVLVLLLSFSGQLCADDPIFETAEYQDLVAALGSQTQLYNSQWYASLGARYLREVMRSHSGFLLDGSVYIREQEERDSLQSSSATSGNVFFLDVALQNIEASEWCEFSAEINYFGDPSGFRSEGDYLSAELFKSHREKSIPYMWEGSRVTIDGTEFQFLALPSGSFHFDVTLFKHFQFGYGRSQYAYVTRFDPYGEISSPETKEDTFEFVHTRVQANILNIASLCGLPWTGRDIELLNEVSLPENSTYTSTETMLKTGSYWLPAMELLYFPNREQLMIGSVTADIPLPFSFLTVKGAFANRAPHYAELDAFLDLAPVLLLFDENRPEGSSYRSVWKDMIDSRREFVQNRPGSMVSFGSGLRHNRLFPYSLREMESDNLGYYFSVNNGLRMEDGLVYFFDISVQYNTMGTINEILGNGGESENVQATVQIGFGF